MRAAWRSFFDDVEGPGGVKLQTRYVRMFAHLVSRFANDDAVAGYDVMNEPNVFDTPESGFARAGHQLEVFVPTDDPSSVEIELSGLDALESMPWFGGTLFHARATGGPWSIRITR